LLCTPLHCACYHGHTEIVSMLAQDDRVDINVPNEQGKTALHVACAQGNVDVVGILLTRPEITVNQADEFQSTPLICACRAGDLESVKALLASGNVQTEPTQALDKPLEVAILGGHDEIATELLLHIKSKSLPKPIATRLVAEMCESKQTGAEQLCFRICLLAKCTPEELSNGQLFDTITEKVNQKLKTHWESAKSEDKETSSQNSGKLTVRNKLERRSTAEIPPEVVASNQTKFKQTASMTIPSEPIAIENLIVTQNSVRAPDSIEKLVEVARKGGKFTGICLFSFPDGKIFLHDGHHRVVAIFMSGRMHLEPDEYVIINSTYDDINTVFFEKYFVTPYDPRVEMRHHDFGDFKQHALGLYKEGKEEEARKYVEENRHLYSFPRCMTSINDLIETMERNAVEEEPKSTEN